MTSKSVLVALIAATVCIPAAAMAMASAELYSTKAHFYGRFEARIRFAPGDGVISSFFLWKEGSESANAYWNELDIEKLGANCSLQTNAFYGNPETVHEQKHTLSADLCGEYHDYGFEWTPTYIAWLLDRKEIRRDTGATATAFSQNASAGMTMHFNVWPGNAEFGGNIKNTTLPVRQYISWVQYSSYDDGSFNVQWREEFQSSGIPSGWAVGNWASPYDQSTHNTQNVSFVNGIAVLSLTADNATGNPGTPPADPNASTGTGGSLGTGGGSGSTTSGAGGTTSTGGMTSSGGTTAAGGTTRTGGTSGSGGATGGGGGAGASASGGTTGGGGMTAAGGAGGTGGTSAAGGAIGSGGGFSSGGAPGSGGTSDAGGTTAAGGSVGSGGTTSAGGATATATDPGGGAAGTTTTEGGCSCSTVAAPSAFGSGVWILFLIALHLRRKEI